MQLSGEDLRLVHYSWFGKLIKGLWEENKKLFIQQMKKLMKN